MLWTECVSPKFICWSPNPQYDDTWRWGPWEIKSREWNPHEWDQCPYKKGPENTARRWLSAYQEEGPPQICWHLDLWHSSFQSCEKEMAVVEDTPCTVLCFSSPHWLLQQEPHIPEGLFLSPSPVNSGWLRKSVTQNDFIFEVFSNFNFNNILHSMCIITPKIISLPLLYLYTWSSKVCGWGWGWCYKHRWMCGNGVNTSPSSCHINGTVRSDSTHSSALHHVHPQSKWVIRNHVKSTPWCYTHFSCM